MLFPYRSHSKQGSRNSARGSATGSSAPGASAALAASPDATAIDVETAARAIEARGMAVPALVALQAGRPLSWLGGQLLWVLQPFFEGVGIGKGKSGLGAVSVPGLARLFEQQGAIERLTARLEVGLDMQEAGKARMGGEK